ncbi:N-6 DNA methylase [Helicobacter marmotae]|uniref:SAM-dependent methyltransferase n=1 Tax=Helicobacter marmotae TaxID=152490 RepID=A0A3D8I1I3_9HELI|nr:N-6 DNA methylase [Helicobacter marmotae]RDU58993.1 SAM-dependent methyltransferase [Helicobacter marmotae]
MLKLINKIQVRGGGLYTDCLIRDRQIKLTPEEIVRQLYLDKLINEYHYPKSRIQVEYSVHFGREVKRADIVVMDKLEITSAYIIIEVKKPKLKDGKEQLKSYCNATGATIAVWSNGSQVSYYHRKDPNYFESIPNIPTNDKSLKDILNQPFTFDDLIKTDILIMQKRSLKDIVTEMEDEVLANAGVDVFEEVFKLIFIKLYDELEGARDKNRNLEFKNYGESDTELKVKIEKLFDKAKKKWEGVFNEDEKIKLSPSHLGVCVSSLEETKLFNSNLEVIDDAFEYLVNKSAKGEKGQYFTPRYVIDMCVKMLNPKKEESMIDTASGSCGFPIHTCFYVWKQIYKEKGVEASHLFTAEKKIPECEDYVKEKIFGVDFDERSVRVSKMLNLIAGDGHSNVLYLNSIDYERWEEWTKDESWTDVYNEGFKKLKKLRANKDENRDFNFDVLMANPPFAGDIKESRILARYELRKDSSGKVQNKVGRDILFIERNLDMLKPGGRMAIVLPQGRFNNSSDRYIREFIATKARILAVVGLHGNVFKPHTNTKTSVLFLQKWGGDDGKGGELCPKKEDYNIFFATMSEPSKDNSGEKIYYPLLDSHGHLVVKHDLFHPHLEGGEPLLQKGESKEEFDARLQEFKKQAQKYQALQKVGIAEAFIAFAKAENLSFWRE